MPDTVGQQNAVPGGSSRSPITALSQTNMTAQSPSAPPTFKVTLDLSINKLININTIKLRESGEWNLMVKVFFVTDKAVAISDSVVITAVADAKINLTVKLDINTFGDIDNLVHYPLIINLYEIEVFTRDPKKKAVPEDKVDLIGQCLLDLLPMVLGTLDMDIRLPVFLATRPVDPDDRTTDQPLFANATEDPGIVLSAHTDQQMVPEEILRLFNIVTLDINGCYQLPTAWLSGNAHIMQPTYTIATSMPSTADHDRFLLVTGRIPQPKVDLSQQSTIRWPSHPLFVTRSVYMTQTSLDLKDGSGLNSDAERPCIMVNTQFRCVLSRDAEEAFKMRAMATNVWPVEIFNLTFPEKHVFVTKKKNAEVPTSVAEDAIIARHGVAYVDVSSLLYPGSKSAAGEYAILPFETHDFLQRTGKKSAGLNVFSGNAPPTTDAEKVPVVSSTKKGADSHASTMSPAKKSVTSVAIPDGRDGNVSAAVTHQTLDETEKQLYLINQSCMQVKIKLKEPLVPKRRHKGPPLTFATNGEIAQCRVPLNCPHDNGFQAVQDFRMEIKQCYTVAANLFNKFSRHSSTWVETYQKIEKELYTSGELCLLLERLKRRILHIVRDRFHRAKPFENDEYQEFLSELYADLVREVHLTYGAKDISVEPKDDSSTSFHNRILALEAEIDGKFLKAEKLLTDRLRDATDESRGQLRVELGQFQLRHHKFQDAIHSFSESLISDCYNIDCLLLFGYALLEHNNVEDAVAVFQTVTYLSDNSPVAWTALGIVYETLAWDATGGYNVLKERAYYQANVALGHSEERMKEYGIQLKNLDRLCGSEVPLHFTSQEALERYQKILRKIVHPRVPAKTGLHNQVCIPDPVNPLFCPALTLSKFDAKKRHKYHPKSAQEDNIFYYSLPYFSGAGMFLLTTRCIVKLNGVCGVKDPVFWKSSLTSWMQRKRRLEAQNLVNELDALQERSATFYVHKGTLAFVRKDYRLMAESFDAALSLDIRSWDRYSVCYRFGQLASEVQDHRRAKDMFQRTTQLHGTSAGWLGCGIASFYCADWFNAEYALNQAAVLDPKDPMTWAYLAMTYMKGDRPEMANKYFAAAQQCGLTRSDKLFQEVEQFLLKQ